MAGDGHFNLEPQSHVTPKTAPILEVKVLLGCSGSCQLSAPGVGVGGYWERRWATRRFSRLHLNKVVAQDRL